MWRKITLWWTKTRRLEAEIERLRERQVVMLVTLKTIATSPKRTAEQHVDAADYALRKIGLMPIQISPYCPPDRIYSVPKGWARPTDYF